MFSIMNYLSLAIMAFKQSLLGALSLAFELGYTIAVPLVVLALTGRLLDSRYQTSPWFLLAGILLSIVVSSWLVYKKTLKIFADIEQEAKK